MGNKSTIVKTEPIHFEKITEQLKYCKGDCYQMINTVDDALTLNIPISRKKSGDTVPSDGKKDIIELAWNDDAIKYKRKDFTRIKIDEIEYNPKFPEYFKFAGNYDCRIEAEEYVKHYLESGDETKLMELMINFYNSIMEKISN